MLKEFCAENFTDVPKAMSAGANRVELCDNLTVGGTTPSLGVLTETLAYVHEKNGTVMEIIRPRGGDFFYNDTELKIMEFDLLKAREAGVDGIVIGCLTADCELDDEALANFADIAQGLSMTFHMAFDEIAAEKQFAAIDYLVTLGFDRILTHGGASGTTIHDNLPRLKELVDYAGGRITILPGGGVTYENVDEIVAVLGVNEAHGTKIVAI
jgi:copper homeostasis protein